MKKSVREELQKKNGQLFILGGVVVVWVILLTTVIELSMPTGEVVSKSYYTPYEQNILNIAQKNYQKNGYEYYIKTKNQDGTYTVSVMKNSSTKISCYLVVNPSTKHVETYDIPTELSEN